MRMKNCRSSCRSRFRSESVVISQIYLLTPPFYTKSSITSITSTTSSTTIYLPPPGFYTATDLSALINNKALGPLGMPLVKKGPGRLVSDVLLVQGFFSRSYPTHANHCTSLSFLFWHYSNLIFETWLIFINFSLSWSFTCQGHFLWYLEADVRMVVMAARLIVTMVQVLFKAQIRNGSDLDLVDCSKWHWQCTECGLTKEAWRPPEGDMG